MNIYKLTQNTVRGYDTYDSAIVIASSEEIAKNIHPSGFSNWCYGSWCRPEDVEVELIGKLKAKSSYEEGDIICSSFNAG